MEIKEIILFAIMFAVLGFSIYRRYTKKKHLGQSAQKQNDSASAFSSGKDDDYEPYSKK